MPSATDIRTLGCHRNYETEAYTNSTKQDRFGEGKSSPGAV